MKQRQRVIRRAVIFPAIALFAWLVWSSPLSDRFDLVALSALFSLRGPLSAPNDVAVIAMDEDSYRELGVPLSQAWPRALHAKLLGRLQECRVRRAVFDVLFAGPGADRSADLDLVEALAFIPSVIGADLVQSQFAGGFKKVEPVLPFRPFIDSAEQAALVGLPEQYGYVARFFTPSQAQEVEGVGVSLASAAAGSPAAGISLPAKEDFISFYGGPGSVTSYSYYQVLDPDLPLSCDRLADKIVFVGARMKTGLGGEDHKDAFRTPASDQPMFGVEIHATAAANILSQKWIRRVPIGVEGLFVALFAAVFGSLILLLPPAKGGAVAMLSIVAWAAISLLNFKQGYFIGGGLPVVVNAVPVYLINTLVNYLAALKVQRATRKAFECYVAPEMVEQLIKSSGGVPDLGGEVIEGVAMFTDIAGFTSVSERLSARQVAEMLNAYFTELMEAVFNNKGTLIKFIGDAAYVIWGAPVKVQDPWSLSVKAALEIQAAIDLFNRRGRFPPLPTRVGLHAGPMLAGNLGAAKRFDYTAVGDTVNLASRVEGLNKYLGTAVLLTDDVRRHLTGTWPLLPMGRVTVVGKSEPVALYAAFTCPVKENVYEMWGSGLRCFENRNWDEARGLFAVAAQVDPALVKAAKFFSGQIDALSAAELDPDWRGQVKFESK